jgi:hypothetical protein
VGFRAEYGAEIDRVGKKLVDLAEAMPAGTSTSQRRLSAWNRGPSTTVGHMRQVYACHRFEEFPSHVVHTSVPGGCHGEQPLTIDEVRELLNRNK